MSGETLDVDVAVLGGGIAGTAISFLLQERENLDCVMIDPQANAKAGTWYPNYGEWQVEWQELAKRLELPELEQCTTHTWPVTDCFFGGSHSIPTDQRTRLQRGYVRVDREKLQWLLRNRFDKAGGRTVPSRLQSKLVAPNLFDQNMSHDASGSELMLEDGTQVRAKLVIDATGSESRLVQRENPVLARGNPNELPTGYQIAYGFTAEVSSPGPYDMDAMSLFDYRTTHMEDGRATEEELRDACNRPTFMYTMPMARLGPRRFKMFFEETSLVGRGERRLSFAECKRRAMKRLAHHGMDVLAIEDEEYCYIPMGGELPDASQRIVAFGGAANMVHPSTGYQACRMLAASTDVSRAIGRSMREGLAPDAVASAAYGSMWTPKARLQRDFQAYGGDFLMLQPVDQLRGFFDAFFSVDMDVWGGFLAGWPGLPGNVHHETWSARVGFALKLFLEMPSPVRIAMLLYSIQYTVHFGPGTLLRSLTPRALTGDGPAPPQWAPPTVDSEVGDAEVKAEAREMMKAFRPSSGSIEGKKREEKEKERSAGAGAGAVELESS